MNLTPEQKKKLSFWLIGIAVACIVVFLGLQNIGVVAKAVSWVFGLVLPLVIGAAFALVLNVPMTFFESRLFAKAKKPYLQKMRRPIAYLISLILILGVLALVLLLVIPEFIEAVKVILQKAIEIVNKFNSMTEEEILELPFGSYLLEIDWNKILEYLQNWLKNQSGEILNYAASTVGSLISGIFNFFVSFVFSVYLLFNKEKLAKQACRLTRTWLPKSFAEWFIHAAQVASVSFKNFISGQTLEALILGGLCAVGMWILRLPYAPMIGALVAVTALIPVVGGLIGAGIGAFMILTIDPLKSLIFIIFLIILQQLEGNLIYPRVMGGRVNLPAMWILAAVTVGGGICGPIGMLLAVPVASTAYVLLREATEKREAKLNAEENAPTQPPSSAPADSVAESEARVNNLKEKPKKSNGTGKKNKNKK